MTVCYQETFVFAVFIRLREQSILIAMSKHHNGVVTTDGTLNITIGACFRDTCGNVLSLLI
jgi:hypothetical protein